MARSKSSDSKRAKPAIGGHRQRKSRRPLTAWTHDGAKAVATEPLTRKAMITGLRERYEDAKLAHSIAALKREAELALRRLQAAALYVAARGDAPDAFPTKPAVAVTVALQALEEWSPRTPVGNTTRIGVDAAFVNVASPMADDDMIADAGPKHWGATREQRVQRVKDLRRR